MNMNRRRSLRRAIAVAAFAMTAAPAAAQETANRLAGHDLAVRWCSSCHLVDAGVQHQGSDAVPTFAAIAAMPSTTAASLSAFLATPHAKMLDYALSRTDIADVSAYILSLRK
jgi:mono/diheme cytochrome c family protein